MKIYEFVHTIVLKQELNYLDSFQVISKYLNRSMIGDDYLKEVHTNHQQNIYNFSGLYPVEKNVPYQKGRVYIFRVRSLDRIFLEKIKEQIKQTKDPYFQSIAWELIEKKEGKIKELVSITPVVLTTQKGYLLPEENPLDFVEKRLRALLEQKYKQFFDQSIDIKTFANGLTLMSRAPIKIPYKNIHILGHKFRIQVETSKEAQLAANLALATGLGEKTSIGFGFAIANYVGR